MTASDAFVRRLERDTLIAIAVLTALALAWRPGELRLALGVAGGGLLVILSYWGIRAGVDGLVEAAERVSSTPAPGQVPRGGTRADRLWRFVKFFTRHAILALAAYAMIARLHLDPVGMLAGVTSPGIAAVAELIRAARLARPAGRSSRDSRSS